MFWRYSSVICSVVTVEKAAINPTVFVGNFHFSLVAVKIFPLISVSRSFTVMCMCVCMLTHTHTHTHTHTCVSRIWGFMSFIKSGTFSHVPVRWYTLLLSTYVLFDPVWQSLAFEWVFCLFTFNVIIDLVGLSHVIFVPLFFLYAFFCIKYFVYSFISFC